MRRRWLRRLPAVLGWTALVIAFGCGPARDSTERTAARDAAPQDAPQDAPADVPGDVPEDVSGGAPDSADLLVRQLADEARVRLVDLTHPLSPESLYWPTGSPFEHRRLAWGVSDEGRWYAAAAFSSAEHLGTHLDAPVHFAEAGWTTTEIPVERFVGAAALMDISARCERDPDATLQPDDVVGWERAHGTLAPGSIVIVRTGWSSRWPDWERYYGSETPKDPDTLRFPGVSVDAATLLAERGIAGVGIDTASLDPGRSTTFEAHRVLAEANIFGLENLTTLDELPGAGSLIVALPMKIEGGTGGPTRVVAFVPR